MKKTLFTFFKLHPGVKLDEGNPVLDTATIIADTLEQALEQCRKQFNPDCYHSITPEIVEKMQEANPVILANNDDLIDLS